MAYKRGSVARPRRKLVWARTLFTATFAASTPADVAYVNLLGQFETQYGADMLGCTIMRIRGLVTWNAGASTSPALGQLICGVRIATSETAGPPAPATELPDSAGPATNPMADWMMFIPVTNIYCSDGSGIIDVRAMRKLDELSQYLLFAAQFGSSPSVVATMNATFSTLLALP